MRQHSGEPHATMKAELVRLLDAVRGVSPGITEPEHLRARSSCLVKVRGEVGRFRERVEGAAQHFAAALRDKAGGFTRDLMAKSVVGSDQKPCVITRFEQAACGRFGYHPSV